jgi:hypothetical protein
MGKPFNTSILIASNQREHFIPFLRLNVYLISLIACYIILNFIIIS